MSNENTVPSHSAGSPKPGRPILRLVMAAVIAAVAVVAALAMLVNILERKQEAKQPFFRVVELTDETEDPLVWQKNFPVQYDSYKRTVDQVRTKYGGSEALPRPASTNADARGSVTHSKIDEDTRLKRMWAGYAFAIDFREERGHAYMLDDQTYTGRQQKPQPGACLNCHASTFVAFKKAGDGDPVKGFEKINALPYAEARKLVNHPVACIDCHDPKTMQLRITRPAFMEGYQVFKASQGIKDYDVNRDATRQEMRSLVCAQCHVEYYFKGTEKRLTYPWHNGLKVENIMAYYDETKGADGKPFKDWAHADTGAPALKAQHPEFELWSQGIHARSGVSCADCHMPYERVGAHKVSNHHVRSPMLNINKACQTCHKWPEQELKSRVEQIQDRTTQLRNLAMDALMDLIDDLKAAKASGRSEAELAKGQDCQRRAQFYLDFVEAENSTGFHAPQESARILGESINFSRQGQNALRGTKSAEAPKTGEKPVNVSSR